MEDFLENLKEALKENPDLVLEIPVKMERMSEDELAELFEDDISDNKEVTEKLPIVEWKFTKKQKKILGYNCYEASTIYNHKQFTVYFTKELNVFGSPAKFPFIKGVVLEYKYGNSVSCATKVDLNQPTITKFL